MKKYLKTAIGILVIALMAAGLMLFRNHQLSDRQILTDDYFKDFDTPYALEKQYSQMGDHEVSSTTYPSDNSAIGKIHVFYPSELDSSDGVWPMIMIVNPTDVPAARYQQFFERLASWGFVVVGCDDDDQGTGETASLVLDYMLEESSFGERIDRSNIGIAGYSQGGAGALAAVTMYENGGLYKTIFTGSAVNPQLAASKGWEYDYTKVAIPYFMTASTGKMDDSGKGEVGEESAGYTPLASLVEVYDGMSGNVFKVRGRIAGADHSGMLLLPDGYMTAWMLYQLQGDEEAGKVFLGEDAEILQNDHWVDVEKTR